MRDTVTFQQFTAEVEKLLNGTAAGKGYNASGPDSQNALYEFVQHYISGGGQAHAMGEIIYKAVRYQGRGNPEDLLKIAAWAFLAWKHHDTRPERTRQRETTSLSA
jgi:hypothetical protein